MIVLCFLLGFALYCISALISYGKIAVSGGLLIICGCLIGACTHLLWLAVSRLVHSPANVFSLALLWDVMLALTFALTPVFLGQKIGPVQFFGAAFVFIGVFLVR